MYLCILQRFGILPQQYESLIIAGECQAKIKINSCVIHTNFVVVDVEKQLLLLGRD